MNLRVVPFGNAVIDKIDKTLECEHGLGECDVNSYQQCLVAVHPLPRDHLPAIACLYEQLPMGRHDYKLSTYKFEYSPEQANLDFGPIQHCHDSEIVAWTLMESAADATPSEHDHVPWIVIDGVHMNEQTQDFLSEICKAYVAKGGLNPTCEGAWMSPMRKQPKGLQH